MRVDLIDILPAYFAQTIMDERVIKRLLIILGVSIVAILLIKTALTKTYAHLNDAVVAKKQAVSAKPASPEQTSLATELINMSATSGVAEAGMQESLAASGVSEAR